MLVVEAIARKKGGMGSCKHVLICIWSDEVIINGGRNNLKTQKGRSVNPMPVYESTENKQETLPEILQSLVLALHQWHVPPPRLLFCPSQRDSLTFFLQRAWERTKVGTESHNHFHLSQHELLNWNIMHLWKGAVEVCNWGMDRNPKPPSLIRKRRGVFSWVDSVLKRIQGSFDPTLLLYVLCYEPFEGLKGDLFEDSTFALIFFW